MDVRIYKRLELATPTELNRLCGHLRLKRGASRELIEKAYFEAAEHTITTATRPLFNNKLPIYSYVLKCVYKEMRSFAETLDENWQHVTALNSGGYQSPIEKMSDSELEDRIGKMHLAAASDAHENLLIGKGWRRVLYDSIIKLGGKSAFTFLVTRLPLAGAGPAGVALGVLLIGKQVFGPAYRKLIPTTIELISIDKRIDNMPKEEEV
jgi:hypothetical protein